ncbi:hypothetical protein C0993_005531 [Termitomyces sp. T159_Od127]|nr:hypothetical protein C0993_005531 [Termitomyces sp. T159_Od127]
MDVGIPAYYDDITRIFDDDDDVNNVYDCPQASVETTEGHPPTTIETRLLRIHDADSPASLDIPTDIFHTPSRPVSESRNSPFTPTPLPSPSPAPVRRRVVMSHIAVPPFPRRTSSTNYRPIPRFKQLLPSRPDVQIYMSLGEALQTAMNNNGAIRTVSSQKRVMAGSRAESVALSRPATGVVKNKKETEEAQAKENERERENGTELVPYSRDVDEKQVVGIAASVSSVVPTRRPSRRLRRREFGYATYEPELDVVHLTICGIPHEPQDIVSANTRFLRETTTRTPTSKEQWSFYSTKSDTDDYSYTRKWSSSCESLEGMEEALTTGEFWLVVDDSSAEEWEEAEEEEEVIVHEEEDNEIIFIGRSGPSQPRPQTLPDKVVSKGAKNQSASNSAVRDGMPSVDDDEVEIVKVSFSPKQTKPRAKPKARLRMGCVVSPLGQVGSHDDGYRLHIKAGERGRVMLPPQVPHRPRLMTTSRENERNKSAWAHKRLRADDDEEEHRPSAQALGKRRAVSPGIRDTRHVQRVQLPVSPSLPEFHSQETKTSIQKPSSKPSELLEMADMISSTMRSHPPPPQFFSDRLASPLPFSSPKHVASTAHVANMTAEALYMDHSLPPLTSKPHSLFDSRDVMDSSSGLLEPHASALPFLYHAITIGDRGPFLAGDHYLQNPTDDFSFPSPENRVTSNEIGSRSLAWSPGNGTIDPSLLGGHPQEHFTPSHSLPAVSSAYLSLTTYNSDTPSPSASPPPPPRPASTPRRSPSPTIHSSPSLSRSGSSSPEQQPHLTSNDSSRHHANGPPLANPRTHDTATRFSHVPKRSRLPNGMISIADVHLDGDSDGEWLPVADERPKKKARATRLDRPRTFAADDLTSESEYEEGSSSGSKAIVLQKRPVTAMSKPNPKQSGSMLPEPEWPRDLQEEYCHQKRGEEYVSLRGFKANKKPFQTPITRAVEHKRASDSLASHVARRRPGGKTNLPTPTIPGPIQYWATIYGIGGERIGNAFVGNGNQSLVLPHFLGSPSLQQSRSRNRVYIGEIQDSWGLGDKYSVKDLDPVPWYERNNGPNGRVYVGAKVPLSWFSRKRPKASFHQHEQPISSDIRLSSPLSSLDESEVGDSTNESETGEGESHKGHRLSVVEADCEMAVQGDINGFVIKGPGTGFSADSLGDTDVARAISLGLIACGMTVQLSSC